MMAKEGRLTGSLVRELLSHYDTDPVHSREKCIAFPNTLTRARGNAVMNGGLGNDASLLNNETTVETL